MTLTPLSGLFGLLVTTVHASTVPLVVVEDHGGDSTLPYYRALNLQPRASSAHDARSALTVPPPPSRPYREADFLPVHSERLTPGTVTHRVIDVPGLKPIFLIGDDSRSRTWLHQQLATLQRLRAVGFVVSVTTEEALASLRKAAVDLTLVPSSAEDFAQRLNITHYPVLITATGIEQ